jgi:hypothetical protein
MMDNFKITGVVRTHTARDAENYLAWLSEFKDPDNGASVVDLKVVSPGTSWEQGPVSETAASFPNVGDDVLIHAGTHAGRYGTVTGIDSSEPSPITVQIDVATLGGNTAQYVENFRPDEVSVSMRKFEPETESETEQAQEKRDDENYFTALSIALDAVLGPDAPVRDRIDAVALEIADALDQKDKEARQ